MTDQVNGSTSVMGDPLSTPKTETTEAEILTALVGEGKKYKTVEELAKAYVNADEFMETLKTENRELREKVTKASTIEEMMERLSARQSTEKNDHSSTPTNGTVSVADLKKLVAEAITGLETDKTKAENFKKANDFLKEQFVEKASDVYKEVAKTPALDRLYKELAQVDPDEFKRRFIDVPKNTSQVDTSGRGSQTIHAPRSNRVNTPGTKEYYDNIRRTNKSLYYSQDFQIKMDRDVRNNPNLYYGKPA